MSRIELDDADRASAGRAQDLLARAAGLEWGEAADRDKALAFGRLMAATDVLLSILTEGGTAPRPEGVPDDVRELLVAVRETLDVPHPAHYGDERERRWLVCSRALSVRGVLSAVVEGTGTAAAGAEVLRRTEAPVTYATDDRPGAGEVR